VDRAQDAGLAARLAALAFLDRKVAWDANVERRVDTLTPAEIQAALGRHLDPAKMSIVKAGDFAKTGTTH
jgi:zinc protease